MTDEVRSRGSAVAGSGLGMTRRRRLLVTAFVALAFYTYAWAVQPNRPQLTAVFATPPKLPTVLENGIRPSEAGTPAVQYEARRWGWYAAWYDQFHYARMARAIARGQLPGIGWDAKHMVQKNPSDPHEIASFSYGLGYPAVGAVFYGLGFHGDPFVVPDGLLFALAAMLALIVAERVLSPVTAFVVVNALVLTAPLVRYFVIPYGTSLTAVAVLLGLVLVTGDRFDWKLGAAFGVVAALTFAARYTDLVWLVVLVSIPLVRRWRESWRVIVAFAAAIAVAAVIVLWAQDHAFGDPFTTPYHFVHNGLERVVEGVPAPPDPEGRGRGVPHRRPFQPVRHRSDRARLPVARPRAVRARAPVPPPPPAALRAPARDGGGGRVEHQLPRLGLRRHRRPALLDHPLPHLLVLPLGNPRRGRRRPPADGHRRRGRRGFPGRFLG